ncbi:MAG: hypothetical protein PQJ60_11180 [Spirochaetales bacterium]|nr:hypothetical protein [Spirochaetales bacterium]
MKTKSLILALILSLTTLYGQEANLLLSAPDRGECFFPFPLRLENSYLTLTYRSSLSCRLTLTNGKEETVLELPPLEGQGELSTKFTVETVPAHSLSLARLEDWNGNPVPFELELTPASDYSPFAPYSDHQTILDGEGEIPGDYLLYHWVEGNHIYIFDFLNYDIQDLYFKRLAFFMEKPGYRGTLMTDEEIEGLHGWNAHDYSKEGLAAFYNLALQQDFPLNRQEEDLKQLLLNLGILKFDGESYLTGRGAIVSITRETGAKLRQRFITHESLHGLFFTDEEFRESIRAYWFSLPKEYRAFWRFFMVNNFYDPEDEVLMYNEILGYTLQLHRNEVEGYFLWRFNRIKEIHPEKAPYVDEVTSYLPEVMLQVYDQLEYLAGRRYSYRNGAFHESD